MRILCTCASLALVVLSSAVAQETSLNRAEVAAIKAKLVAVQGAMGTDPEGYLKESEEFSLPTDFSPAQEGKFWPIGSSISLGYTDRASTEGQANAERAAAEFQAKYAAAIASGDATAIERMLNDLNQINAAAAAASVAPQKQDMSVYVQFNSGSYSGIDPDAVVFERSGVIALRDTDVSSEEGSVTVYLDPVALKETETLSKLELKTPDGGVANRSGVFNITIQLNGTVADAEAWAQTFDTAAMLSVIDSQ
jgi:hypothetical protein